MELSSHAETCVLGGQYMITTDQWMYVFGYDHRVGSKHAFIVDFTVTYDEYEKGQVFILLIHQAMEVKGLNHHLLCPMQCCMNGTVIDEVSNFLAPIPSETMNAI